MGSCDGTDSESCAEGACIFPFIYNRRLVTSCTSIDDDPTPWCATGVDSSGQMTSWGHCQGECPLPQQNIININPHNDVGSCCKNSIVLMLLLHMLSLVCGVPNCETTDNTTKIVGGTPACTGQYPWQVNIEDFNIYFKVIFFPRLLFYGLAVQEETKGVEEL